MSPPELYPICQIGQGQIAIMPKPPADSSAQLSSAVEHYAKLGVTHIVSLLRTAEIETLKLQQEATTCANYGIEFVHFPIKDMDVPERTALQQFIEHHLPKIQNGAYYSFHCHGGRGRAGTLAISLMLNAGYQYDEAVTLASNKRGDTVPVCDTQREFLKSESFARDNK